MIGKIIPFRERLRQKRRLVLFICTGNTCRSPMASGYFRKLLDERGIRDIEVRSAGVMTITGLLASQEAIQVMDNEGVDLRRHRSTQLTPELIRKADLILAMSPFHRQTALRMAEDAKDKTFLFKEFCKSDLKNVQIADPMGCTLEVFKKCFKEVKAACDRLIDHEFITGKSGTPRPAARRVAALAHNKSRGGKKPSAAKTGAAKAAAPRNPAAKGAAAKSALETGQTAPQEAKAPSRRHSAGESESEAETPRTPARKKSTAAATRGGVKSVAKGAVAGRAPGGDPSASPAEVTVAARSSAAVKEATASREAASPKEAGAKSTRK
ncbi:MAG: hypothetical protein M1457_02770 [bacterium]|nr:hypothetical protein [bacterium]